jgi:serine/threonine protein kinase
MLFIEEGKDYEDVDAKQLPYDHVQNLGFGHSGNVEEVRDRNTNKVFARKTIRIPVSRVKKAESTSVFYNEVKIIRGLGKHRHIVSVFATYATTQVFGILLQPVASDGDLEHFLAEYWHLAHKPHTEGSSAYTRMLAMSTILEQGFGCLTAALSFMHEKKVRHKDIKPNNILVHDGILIYTDFGYSFDTNGFTHSTTEGRPDFLTRRYCAPEVRDHEKRNSRSDVWSLGCVFIDMLSAITLALTVDSEKSFSETMEQIHEQLSSIKHTGSLDVVCEIIIHMTQLDCQKRICSAHATSRIIQTRKLCCLDCSQGSNTIRQTYSTQETCDITCILNRRDIRKKHNSFGVFAGAGDEDRPRPNDEIHSMRDTYPEESSRASVEKSPVNEVYSPLETDKEIIIFLRTGERKSTAEFRNSNPGTIKPLLTTEHSGNILGLDTLHLDQDQKQATAASHKILSEVEDSASSDSMTTLPHENKKTIALSWIWSDPHQQHYYCTHDENGMLASLSLEFSRCLLLLPWTRTDLVSLAI